MADKQLQARVKPYAATIAAVESQNGIPPGLLTGLLAQESDFDPAVISGQRKSKAGAQGVAQFMPKTAKSFGIDPLDPSQAINASGQYLSKLKNKYGTWPDAMRAYNWGPGNYDAYLKYGKGAKGQPIPQEAKEYPGRVLAKAAAVTGRALTDVSLPDSDGNVVMASPAGKGPKAATFKVGDSRHTMIAETPDEEARIASIQNSDMPDEKKDAFYSLFAQLSPVATDQKSKPLVDTNENHLDDMIESIFDAA